MNRRSFLTMLGLLPAAPVVYSFLGSGIWMPGRNLWLVGLTQIEGPIYFSEVGDPEAYEIFSEPFDPAWLRAAGDLEKNP